MARAVIHNSDYPSVEAAKEAIDGHFHERNLHFSKHPKRAGQKIWRMERVPSEFRGRAKLRIRCTNDMLSTAHPYSHCHPMSTLQDAIFRRRERASKAMDHSGLAPDIVC